MDLSNLQPKEGSRQSDNFRRGQETERQQVRDIRDRRLVQEHPDPDLKAARCLYTEDFPREVSHAEILLK